MSAAAGHTAQTVPTLPELSGESSVVLNAAAKAFARFALLHGADPDTATREAHTATTVLELWGKYPAVRAKVRASVEKAAQTSPAWAQVVACPLLVEATAKDTASQLSRAIEQRRREEKARERRERRDAEREAAKKPLEEVRVAREEDKLEQIRQARDLATRRAETAAREASQLRDQLESSRTDVDDMSGQLAAVTARLRSAQEQLTDPVALAAALAAALADLDVDATIAPVPAGGLGTPATMATAAQSAIAHQLPPEAVGSVQQWLPVLLRALTRPVIPVAQVRELQLRVDVLGGGTEVGGSCVLVEAGGTRILVDAGTRPGAGVRPPRRIEHALRQGIDAVIITHAHADHAGWVPALVRDQPGLPVFATPATGDLLEVMWPDAVKVMAAPRTQIRSYASTGWGTETSDGPRGAGAGTGGTGGTGGTASGADGRERDDELEDDEQAGTVRPYTATDVAAAMRSLRPTPFGHAQRIGELSVTLFPAGHIVGAAGVVIQAGDQRVVVSGDVSGPGQLTVSGIELPEIAIGADLMLLESTYGDHDRIKTREGSVADFVAQVRSIIDSGGRVLVPSFALGRAQEVALIMAQHLPQVPVYVDGLARSVSRVYEEHDGADGRAMRIFAGNVRAVRNGGVELRSKTPAVIVATSGMLTAGPAISWARELLPDPSSGLLIVGYQDEESPGRVLQDLARTGGGTFDLPSRLPPGYETVTVKATVGSFQLGAHASAPELVQIADQARADTVMLVHGDRSSRVRLGTTLERRGFRLVDAGGPLELQTTSAPPDHHGRAVRGL